jgi:hypothetical protein
VKWQPAKPRLPIKVVECGPGKWDEREHGLDYPATIHTTDFRVTGRGHARIEQLFQNGCAERGRRFPGYSEKQPEQRIAMWLCQHASSFVMIDTKARATVIGLERDEDADAFRREFVQPRMGPQGP